MKKMLYLFTITVLLSTRAVHAMDPAPMPRYQFSGFFETKYSRDIITSIKKISPKYLAVFDLKGRGELFDIDKNYASGLQIDASGMNGSSFTNMFVYQCDDDRQMLVAYHLGKEFFHVWKLDGTKGYSTKVFVAHFFSLAQTKNGDLVMHSKQDNSISIIDFTWKVKKLWDQFPHQVLFDKKPVNLSSSDLLDEGLIVDFWTLQDDRCTYGLRKEIFDITTLEGLVGQKLIDSYGKTPRLEDIYCYHKHSDTTIFLGHACGKISIWKPIKEETLL